MEAPVSICEWPSAFTDACVGALPPRMFAPNLGLDCETVKDAVRRHRHHGDGRDLEGLDAEEDFWFSFVRARLLVTWTLWLWRRVPAVT